jgi:hypothetical protein
MAHNIATILNAATNVNVSFEFEQKEGYKVYSIVDNTTDFYIGSTCVFGGAALYNSNQIFKNILIRLHGLLAENSFDVITGKLTKKKCAEYNRNTKREIKTVTDLLISLNGVSESLGNQFNF